MFSPRVWLALDVQARQRLVGVVLLDQRLAGCLNLARSAGVHQLRSLPVASNVEPRLSKLWLISWPITAPIAP